MNPSEYSHSQSCPMIFFFSDVQSEILQKQTSVFLENLQRIKISCYWLIKFHKIEFTIQVPTSAIYNHHITSKHYSTNDARPSVGTVLHGYH